MPSSMTRRSAVLSCTLAPVAAVIGLAAFTACSTGPGPVPLLPAGAAQALAPHGRLRACINLGNPILANRDAAGVVGGVSVDLATLLAQRLGVPLELIVVEAALQSVDTVKTDRADIGFFAIDPRRSDGIGFSAPYVLIEGAYLVRNESPLTDNAQVDRSGTRVMVGRGSAYDLYLSRELKAAQLMRTPTSQAVVERFLAEGADVAAGVRQQLESDAARLPGLRLLPGRFMVIEQAMGLPLTRGAAATALLAGFVEQAKAGGFVAQSLARHRIHGAVVAPASR
ncbi:transporter substrate-binding domain-containing protein [Rhizobacter sp. SG703]|uniref:transporter substrate-binding domain-containing protein n=1 Tax=Rhizobacter sp. SG703 TaxID=2587140 RepID=UPI0017E4B5D0|nr:transporter substrate-binding domain-containing protein [Rhizobacter sp. SG703]NKI97580.1 polar amino acid transport system substrate-binding protein [Rhizobacter sp. SG703]